MSGFRSDGRRPELSLVMPCYNEEQVVAYSVRRLVNAFEREGHALELIVVDNGSTDSTGTILQRLAQDFPQVVAIRVAVNRGYGNGILEGLEHAHAPWVGYLPADGQVDSEDVVRLFESALVAGEQVLAKVRRRFRMDGFRRRLVTLAYNSVFRLFWPHVDSYDINAVPKLFPQALVGKLKLESSGWGLDPELMIKIHHLGVRVLEYNVLSRGRAGGTSHVRATTALELLRALLEFRFSRMIPSWRASLARGGSGTPLPEPGRRPAERTAAGVGNPD